MSSDDARLRNSMGYYPRGTDAESRKREAVLRIAEQHVTAMEFSADMADEKVDVRIYDDGIVLMRKY